MCKMHKCRHKPCVRGVEVLDKLVGDKPVKKWLVDKGPTLNVDTLKRCCRPHQFCERT